MAKLQTSAGVVGVDIAGDGRVPILFLHGVGSDKSVWRPQLEHFGKTRRAVAIDYPGYGESALKPNATRDDFARAALATLDALEIASAHICGLSLGGVVAIAMYALAPGRCASLILADSFAVHPDGCAIYERSLAASDNLRAMAEARVDVLLAQPADPEVRREVVETMAGIDPAAYRLGAEAVWLADQRDRAQGIAVPTLVLVGDQDLVTPVDLSNDLVDLIPDARMQVIQGAGHLSNLEKPTEFNRSVDQFISRD